jgi:signal transduction histidine kinase
VVHPVWYVTWWAKTLYVVLSLGLTFAFYRRRLQQVERQKAILEDLVQVRTLELMQRNEEIEAQRDSIEATNVILNAAKEELKTINNELEERVEQRTEELQRAYIKLLESNQELDTFIYRASHDIRGPVARLQGLCKVALMDVDDSKALEYFELLDRTGEETNQTLVRVLRIYEIRNIEVDSKPIHLTEFIEAITEPLRITHVGMRIELSLVPGLTFCSDEKLLLIILQNIIGNAFQYNHHRTDPFVRIEVLSSADKSISIRVSDNGNGIPEDLHQKLFTMFFKGTTHASGPGLGLYISRIAAEKLGGKIRYNGTQPGVTTFEVQLPCLDTIPSNPLTIG